VCCGRYLALQLSGGIPTDRDIAISSLDAQRVLATETKTETETETHGKLRARMAA
jgi:hypothetical protein